MRSSTQIIACTAPLLLAAIGCGGGSNGQPTMCFGANVVANESNNYAFSSTITLPPVTVAPKSNLTFDWSGLTKDFLGHPLNPATDIVMGVMMIWNLKRADFETALNADQLYTADLVVSPPLNLPIAGATSAQLHQFLVNGTAVTPAMFNDVLRRDALPASHDDVSRRRAIGHGARAETFACCRRSSSMRRRRSQTWRSPTRRPTWPTPRTCAA